jgi:hypothetical protein
LSSLELVAQLEGVGVLTSVGLQLDGEITPERAEAMGRLLGRAHSMLQFAIGDWMIEMLKRFGDDAYQMFEALGVSEEARQQYLRVSERVALERRRDALSWSHHREVARLDDIDQEVWLERAEANSWSKNEMYQAMKDELGPRATAELPPPAIVVHRIEEAAKRVAREAIVLDDDNYSIERKLLDELRASLGMT